MFYVFDKLLEFDNLNINQKKYIEKLKYKVINISHSNFKLKRNYFLHQLFAFIKFIKLISI